MNLIPASVVTGPLNSNQINQFRGVKRGDVDGTCASCGTSIVQDPVEGRDENLTIHKFFISDHSLKAGEELYLPITSQFLSEAVLWGMQLDFDNEKIELLSVESQSMAENDMVLSNMLPNNTSISAYCSWMSMKPQGEILKDGAVIAYLHLRAKKDITTLQGLISQPNNPDYRVIKNNESNFLVNLEIQQENLGLSFSVKLLSQNPLVDNAFIEVSLPEADDVNLIIFDNAGQIMSRKRYSLSAGLNSLVLNEGLQLSGMYTAAIQTKFGIQNLRFLKI